MSVFLLNACSQSNTRSEQEEADTQSNYIPQNLETTTELTPVQESAFDALNTLQVSTDEMNRLYSTFAGIDQPCYPPDTTLTISQSELLEAMKQFVTSHCKYLESENRDELASTSVLAQQEYTLSICFGNSENVSFEKGLPMSGTWILPSILDRRDLVIVW
ncbi:MAG: hypothetical protein SchgKO_19970 [Schleiferiaceae bacterium]